MFGSAPALLVEPEEVLISREQKINSPPDSELFSLKAVP
jgi:hypothetical protein